MRPTTAGSCRPSCGQALKGEPITVFGDGSQTRSFCYVDDLVDGILRLLFSDLDQPCNIGNPAEMTIKQFAEAIIKFSNSKSTIVYEPLPVDDPKQRKPDITRARQRLHWEPKVALEQGIGKTMAYFRNKV